MSAFGFGLLLTRTLYRSTALTTTQLEVTTSAGPLTVPVNGTITLDGRESKILVTDYVFGAHATNVLYSTAEYVSLRSFVFLHQLID